jgi:hypothetical protein
MCSRADQPLLRVNVFLTLFEVRKYQAANSAGVASILVPAGDLCPEASAICCCFAAS